MPIYTDVVASRIEKYRSQLERENGNDADIDMAMFRIAIGGLIGAAFSGGTSTSATSTSATTIAQGINQSTDIDTIALRLTSIDANQINESSVKAAIESAANLTTIINRLLNIDAKLIQQADIVSAIQTATDIDALIAQLTIVANNTYPVGARTIAQSQSVSIASDQVVNVRDRSTTTPIAQTTINLIAGAIDQFVIPANARSLTICITSGGLVHFTEDGTAPTASNCWFGGGTKEIWDYAVPAGATLRLLAVSAATVSIQVRV